MSLQKKPCRKTVHQIRPILIIHRNYNTFISRTEEMITVARHCLNFTRITLCSTFCWKNLEKKMQMEMLNKSKSNNRTHRICRSKPFLQSFGNKQWVEFRLSLEASNYVTNLRMAQLSFIVLS